LPQHLPWIHTGEWKYGFTYSSTSALHGSEWSAACPGCLTPREKKMTLCIEKKLSGLQSQSQHTGNEKKSLATARNWTNISQQYSSQTNHCINRAIPASQFPDSLINLRGTSLFQFICDSVFVECNALLNWIVVSWNWARASASPEPANKSPWHFQGRRISWG
jgi:hypothetical protein